MAYLIEKVAGPENRYELVADGPTRIGSAPDNDLVLAAEGVEPHHARISQRAGRYVLEAVGGQGVQVNKRRGEQLHLDEGDALKMGSISLQFNELVGQRIFWDKYRIERLIGRGSFGTIYEVSDYFLPEIRYAMKVLRNTSSDTLQDLKMLEALTKKALAEAVSLSMLNHENIVTVFLVDQDPSVGMFVLMEYLEGQSLRDALDAIAPRPMSRTVTFPILRDICAGLRQAHDRNIVHGDLTPGNIYLTQHAGRTRAKLIDFGMVSVRQEFFNQAHGSTLSLFRDIARIWKEIPGGTPDYLSPEQAKSLLRYMRREPPDGCVDERSDIYSLGVVIYEMICGRVPFADCRGNGLDELMNAHIHGEYPDPRLFDRRLGEIADRALQKDPNDRYQTVQALLDALERVEFSHIPNRPAADKTSTTCVAAIRRTSQRRL